MALGREPFAGTIVAPNEQLPQPSRSPNSTSLTADSHAIRPPYTLVALHAPCPTAPRAASDLFPHLIPSQSAWTGAAPFVWTRRANRTSVYMATEPSA